MVKDLKVQRVNIYSIIHYMEAQLYLQKTLREKLDELKTKNNSFSLRAFSRLLGVSPASLSEFLNGKRALSQKMIMKMADRLCLSPDEFTTLSDKLVRDKNGIDHKIPDRKTIQVQNDQYYLVADWHYYAILCLAETDNFESDSAWIAKRLKTNQKKVSDALERLLRIGLLEYDNNGHLKYQDITITTSEDMPNTSIKKRHSDTLDAAKESLFTDDVMLRDMSSATMAIDPKKLPQAKKMIREFQDRLCEFLEAGGDKSEVYEVSMQIFPRTQVNKEKIYENFQ
jgi:uncharacterized protein (TIGR02147 family)